MAEHKRIVFFAQDEGSAKALAPVIRNMPSRTGVNVDVMAGKLASKAFKQNNITCRDASTFVPGAAFSPKPDLVVTGASMRVSIEKEAIRLARTAGIPSATLLDSSTWLWWRFTVDGARDLAALPDRILVPDPACKERMVGEQFPAERLIPTGNPHFDMLMTRAASPSQSLPRSILVVTQPRYKNGEYRSDLPWLETVLTLCRKLEPDSVLTVRPHGKEDSGAFNSLLARQDHVDANSDILDLIDSHQLVIGKNSSALIEAALMGKSVISFARNESERLWSPMDEWGLFHQAMNSDDLETMIRVEVKRQMVRKIPRGIRYYTDGRNSERVRDSIMKMINISRK